MKHFSSTKIFVHLALALILANEGVNSTGGWGIKKSTTGKTTDAFGKELSVVSHAYNVLIDI